MTQQTSEGAPSEHPSTDIIKKGSVITIITLISRPLGFIREAVQAYLFGATLLVDAFIVAFNFPELVRTLFFSGATSAFLIPVCTKYLESDKEYSRIYSTFVNLSVIVTLPLSLLFFLLSGAVVSFIAPGFSPATKSITQYLFVIMIPVISLNTILSVIKAFLNAKEHFAAPELSGILWNIVFILAALVLHRSIGIYSLAVGVTVGSFLQIIIQIPYLKRFSIRYTMTLSLRHPAVREAKNLFLGALIATSIVPINSFVGRIIGSYLPQGEVASLAYAFRIFVLPFSLFAVPVYTVTFSKISKLYHDNDKKGMFSHIDGSTTLLCITLIPSTILLCATGQVLVKILYQRGAFTIHDTLITNRALFGYGTGLLFYALSYSFGRVFNAFHDVKTPAIIGITSIGLNALLAYALMLKYGNLGISLATSIVSFYNFAMLYVVLRKKIGYKMTRKAQGEVIRSVVAGIILVVLIYVVRLTLPGRTYLSLAINLALTLAIYGVFFKDYYLAFMGKRA